MKDADQMMALSQRDGLPDALRVLLEEYPRAGWQSHPGFGGLTQFWLGRHLMFRRIMESLRLDTEDQIKGVLDPRQHAARLQKLGSMLLADLHGHHQIEDHHYFPKLLALEPRLGKGFQLLDADHHEMDALLAVFAEGANAVLRGGEPGPFAEHLARFDSMLDRHLVDEEELIVPVLLKHGEDGVQ